MVINLIDIFDLQGLKVIDEDIHVILDLFYKGELKYRFGGRKGVVTAEMIMGKKSLVRASSGVSGEGKFIKHFIWN